MKLKNTKSQYIAAKINMIEFYNKTADYLAAAEIAKNMDPKILAAKKGNLVVIQEFIMRSIKYIILLEDQEQKRSAMSDTEKYEVADYYKVLDKSIPNEREALREYSKSKVRELWPELF